MIPETRLVLPPPVASDEAVSEVPIEDVLSVIDCDNLTKNARIHNLANLSTWREIPQDVTYDGTDSGLLNNFCHSFALDLIIGHGLLQNEVVSFPGKCHSGLVVHSVLSHQHFLTFFILFLKTL